MKNRYTMPVIIALLGFNSYLLIKLNNNSGSNDPNQAIINGPPAEIANISQFDNNASQQALLENINAIRLTQKRIEKTLASLNNGSGIITAQSNSASGDEKVVENSAENIAAYNGALQAVSDLSGASTNDVKAAALLPHFMSTLSDQQRADIRNQIANGIQSGAIDPSVAGGF